MRRIGRWMLNALTVLSLLLCVGSVAVWTRSTRRMDSTYWLPASKRYVFWAASNSGQVYFIAAGPFRPPEAWITDSTSAGWLHSVRPSVGVELADEVNAMLEDTLGDNKRFHFAHAGRFSIGAVVRSQMPYIGGQIVSLPPGGFVSLPCWAVTIATAILPFHRVLRRVRRQRSAAGECVGCSYNLTGNVSGVCPECGTKIAATARA